MEMGFLNKKPVIRQESFHPLELNKSEKIRDIPRRWHISYPLSFISNLHSLHSSSGRQIAASHGGERGRSVINSDLPTPNLQLPGK